MSAENPDYLWPVMKPRNGSAEAIEEMNAKMVLFHPALDSTRRENHQVMHDAHDVVQADVSVSELFRRVLSQP